MYINDMARRTKRTRISRELKIMFDVKLTRIGNKFRLHLIETYILDYVHWNKLSDSVKIFRKVIVCFPHGGQRLILDTSRAKRLVSRLSHEIANLSITVKIQEVMLSKPIKVQGHVIDDCNVIVSLCPVCPKRF